MDDPRPGFHATPDDPVRQVFEHWVFMGLRNIRLCKLGPTRRLAIASALAMGYDADILMAAVEGMAADPLDDCDSSRMRDAMREIEWLLAREARIERWAKRGLDLRAEADQPEPASATVLPLAQPVDPAAALAARERMRAIATKMREGRHG